MNPVRGVIGEEWVRTFGLVECQILGHIAAQFAHGGVALQIAGFLLETAPEPLDEDIHQRPA